MAALPYIQIYIADYKADTIGLTTLEHGAYLLLIFHYWQIGGPIKSELVRKVTQVDRRLSAKTTEVLKQFFDLRTHSDGVYWHHKRIDADLERVKSKSKQASKAGKQSGEARRKSNGRSTDNRTDVERTLNHTDTYTYTDTEADKPVAAVASLTVVDKPDNSLVVGLENPKKEPPICPQEKIKGLYAKHLPECVQPRVWGSASQDALRARWREKGHRQNLEWWDGFFAHIRDFDFLMGKTKHQFTLTLSWIVKAANFEKICNGNYENKKEENPGPCR